MALRTHTKSPEPLVAPPGAAASGDMWTEEISSAEGLEKIRPEWSRLWSRCPWATPFQSPQWLIPWWEHLGRGELLVIALRSAGKLAGLAPFYIFNGRVLFLGTGVSDYLDVLLAPGLAQSASFFIDALAGRRERWEICDLQEVRSESPLIPEMRARKIPGLQSSIDPLGVCPVLLLSGIPEPSPGDHPALRTSYRKAWRQITGCGKSSVGMAAADNLEACMDSLFRLHGARWAKRRHPGVLSDLNVRRFHREAASGLLKAGCLRLFYLNFEGETIASLHAFELNRKLYCYLSGFNPRLERLSPGKIVLGSAIEYAVRSGIGEVDFLRGSESYKYQWGVRDRPNFRILIKPVDEA